MRGSRSGDFGLDLSHGLDLGLDVHPIADHHATGFERLVPREPEVLAIDRRLRGERRAHVPPRVLRLAMLFDAEDDLARDSLDGEIADDIDLVPGSRLDVFADEPKLGVLRCVEDQELELQPRTGAQPFSSEVLISPV